MPAPHDDLEKIAWRLCVAAASSGKADLVRAVIRDLVTESVDWEGERAEDDMYDDDAPPSLTAKFAQAWDECVRVLREGEAEIEHSHDEFMAKVTKKQAMSKSELHLRFQQWLARSESTTIAPQEIFGRSAWIFVRDEERVFKIDPDTKREAIKVYMELVAEHGDDIKWQIVANSKGNLNAVAFGPHAKRLKNTFYLYLVS